MILLLACGLPIEVLAKYYRELHCVLVPGGKTLVTNFLDLAYQKLYLIDRADEKLVKSKLKEIIAGLSKYPTKEKMTEVFKDRYEGNTEGNTEGFYLFILF